MIEYELPIVISVNSQSFDFLDIKEDNIAKVTPVFNPGTFPGTAYPKIYPSPQVCATSALRLRLALPFCSLSPVWSHFCPVPPPPPGNRVPHKSLLLHPLEVLTHLEVSSVLGTVSAPMFAWEHLLLPTNRVQPQ